MPISATSRLPGAKASAAASRWPRSARAIRHSCISRCAAASRPSTRIATCPEGNPARGGHRAPLGRPPPAGAYFRKDEGAGQALFAVHLEAAGRIALSATGNFGAAPVTAAELGEKPLEDRRVPVAERRVRALAAHHRVIGDLEDHGPGRDKAEGTRAAEGPGMLRHSPREDRGRDTCGHEA